MSRLSLCFPTFFCCAVKENTPLLQYDAVSILLCGGKRKDVTWTDVSDSVASIV